MNPVFDAYAVYYDLLYQDKDYAREAAYIRDLLTAQNVSRGTVLELGCGTGKHAEHLASFGYEVCGVDRSLSMIAAARSRAVGECAKRMDLREGDVCSFRMDRCVNAVISLFHVASYQTSNEDLLAMFGTAASHLDRGGVFLFDCWYGPAVLHERPSVRIKRMAGAGNSILRIAEPVMRPNDNVVDVNYTVLITNEDGRSAETIREAHHMRYLFAPELKHLLEQSGFVVKDMFEWMTGKPLGLSTWSATIVAIRK